MLQVQNLVKYYGKVLANDNISFSTQEAGVSLLLGPNGSGKTTLLKCIMGLFRYSGEISIAGYNNKTVEAKKVLGFVPEVPHAYPLLTVEEHLEFIARAYELQDWQEDAKKLLLRFELDDKKDKLGATLSKGMQQKLSICTALLPQPKFILFDEPLVGLDPHAIKELKLVFQEIIDRGASLLISTHMLDTVSSFWNQAMILRNGKLVATKTQADLAAAGLSLEDFYFQMTEQ